MGKKDYVLDKAIDGDMDALENVLGRVMSPLFDLAFHFYDDAEAATSCLRMVLEKTGAMILADELGGTKPMLIAAQTMVFALRNESDRMRPWHDCMVGLPSHLQLCFLVNQSLGCDGDDLDFVLGSEPGESKGNLAEVKHEIQIDNQKLREILDTHALNANLPTGLVDDIVTRFEERR